MQKKKLLIIGLVWPEPTSSAAGIRMVQLIHFFLSKNYEINFACAASKSEYSHDLIKLSVKEEIIKLNNESFNHYIKDLKPEIVVFDRYIIEEQYGWRVQQECPQAMTILDTEDLHFLRQARQKASITANILSNQDLFSANTKREIASILRCDLSLIISEEEMKLLKERFKIDQSILFYLPFLEEEITVNHIKHWKTFEQRSGFVFIGNFLHEPNYRAVLTLKSEIWPTLRKFFPEATLNIYGAYPSQKVLQLNNPKENFNIMGRTDDAREIIANHRILIAPILFGAGVKGKFIDAMQSGTPSATTSIGAEAMNGEIEWSGVINDRLDFLITDILSLYANKEKWLHAQQNGVKIINQRYSKHIFQDKFTEQIYLIYNNLKAHREQNFFGQILHHHTNQSTKYMSLWIGEKNKPLAPKGE